MIKKLFKLINNRKKYTYSYTIKLFKNLKLIKKKIIEEAYELVIEKNRKKIINEFVDLLYHSLVLLSYYKINIKNIYKKIKTRMSF
ncbi:phosphoribosyl-ATP diphosphatase [Candidatus Vidania fulgoroideorum]